jgi:hypothetical protein
VVARWYHSGLLRGRGPKKFVEKVSRNDVGVITNELGPFKIRGQQYHFFFDIISYQYHGPKSDILSCIYHFKKSDI